MFNFTSAVRRSIETQNWYAALTLALLMPDICGKLEDPKAKSEARYVSWFDRWMLPKYTSNTRRGPVVFLSGRDCYALRCAMSHEGRDNISTQRAREVLSSFKFNTPHPRFHLHCNQVNDSLQLQVDRFAADICDGVEAWLASVITNETIQERIAELVVIHDTSQGIPGFLGYSQ